MENTTGLPQDLPAEMPQTRTTAENRCQRKIIIGAVAGGLVFFALLLTAIYFLASPGTDTQKIRDIFIIAMGLESLIIGLALVILMIQLARLINLIQNEIKPILDSTNETVSTLRGTTAFLSSNLVEPVMKLNEYFAGLQQLLKLVGLTRRGQKKL